jgi:hypothetical protein
MEKNWERFAKVRGDRLVIGDGPLYPSQPLFRFFLWWLSWSCTGSTFGSASPTWYMNTVLFLHKHILWVLDTCPKKFQVHDMYLFEGFWDVLKYVETSLNPVPNAHVCVCIWWYILQNYNYKLRFQNLYTTFHRYPWGLWPLKILMFALLVTREIATYSWPWEKTRDNKYMLGLLLILMSKSWGLPPPGWACLS